MSARASSSSKPAGSAPWRLHVGRIHPRVAGEDGEAEAERAPADRLADAAEADEAERPAGEAPHALHVVPAPAVPDCTWRS